MKMAKLYLNPLLSLLTVWLWGGVAHSNSSPSFIGRQEFRQFTKHTIKSEILRKLGLSSVPNVTVEAINNNHLVKNLIQKLESESVRGMMSDQSSSSLQDEDTFQPAEVTIIPSQPPAEVMAEHKHWNVLYYRLSERVLNEQAALSEAHLMLHLPASPSPAETQARVRLYYVAIDKKTGKPTQFKAKEGTWELRRERGGMIKIDLINLVSKWMRNPKENLGLVIRVQANKVDIHTPTRDSHMAPYLQLHFGGKDAHRRHRRSTNLQCTEEFDSEVTQCCIWPLTIDFDEFGWDWVLFPRTYEANFCSGDCSLGVVAESPHTHLLQMNLHSTAGPCCAARKMSGISMLYLDQDNNVVMGKLPGMKVERCGCS